MKMKSVDIGSSWLGLYILESGLHLSPQPGTAKLRSISSLVLTPVPDTHQQQSR